MRSDKNSKKNKGTGFKTFTRVWSLLYLLTTVIFLGALIYMNLLPAKYLFAGGAVVAVLALLTFPALYFRNFRKSRKIIALILSILLMVAYGGGIFYVTGTMDFFSTITTVGETTENYYVVARADDSYENKESIKGEAVHTYLTNDIGYAEARNELKIEASVEYDMVENLSELADGLMDESYNLILISEGHHMAVSNESETFKTQTKIIHTIKIKRKSEDVAKNVGVTEEPFNVYVSGLDTEGGIDTVSRSDVNMIVTVNPKTHKVLLTSLPRDSYIKMPGKGGAMDKLTHTGLYGIKESIASVEAMMGIDINYYVKVNYTTVTQLVDAIGGINVNSDYTFTTHGMGVYYEFYEGDNYLDGSRALAFARERKSFADGDFQRNRNQQIVLEAVLKKALSSSTILTKYTSILDAVKDSVEINMPQEDMQKLIKMQLDGMPSWDFEKQSIVGEIGSEQCYSTGDFYTSIIYPDPESIVEAVDKIVAVMDETKKL